MKGLSFWSAMLAFCVMIWFSLYFGFEQTINTPVEKKYDFANDSLEVIVRRLERKLNVCVEDHKCVGYVYDFESEAYKYPFADTLSVKNLLRPQK